MENPIPGYQEILHQARELHERLGRQHGSAHGLMDALSEDEDYVRDHTKLGKEIEKMERYAAKYDRKLVEKQIPNLLDAASRARVHLAG